MKVLLSFCIFFARTLAAPLDNVSLGDNMASTPGIFLVYLCNLLFKIKFDLKYFFGSGEGNEKSKNNSNDWWQLEYLTPNKLDSLIQVVNNLNDVFGNQKYIF